MNRRDFLTTTPAATAAATMLLSSSQAAQPTTHALKGRIKHSICRWCYGGIAIDELCSKAAEMGYSSIELLGPDEWDVPFKYGMTCAVATFVGSNPIHKGFNRVENHDAIIRDLEQRLPLVKARGIPNQICFSGNRAGQADAEGIKNCIAGLKRIVPLAESLNITIIMELLNSKVDHGDYQCDHTDFGVRIVEGVGSDRFKLLYDIYHMQIMEGDVIRTTTDNLKHIAHFHTGGVPGRNEIDGTQELTYSAICRALADAGYTGFVGQEFIPRRDPFASLKVAIATCDV